VARTIQAESPPSGLRYQPDFISTEQEQRLVAHLASVHFKQVIMREVAAKRTTAHFGWSYGYESWKIEPAEPIPSWIEPLRERVGALVGLEPDTFEEVLLSNYPEGAGIGWHRDAPMFRDTVIGISLGAECLMKFRRKVGDQYVVWKQTLEPRSLYVISGEARRIWQHTIVATPGHRFSITFRTIKRR
jgi:DNA oxidative demethylase